VPFEALTGFVDPSVQFGLQFETLNEAAEAAPAEPPAEVPAPQAEAKPTRVRKVAEKPAAAEKSASPEKSTPAKADAVRAVTKDDPDKPAGGAEVVRLDRFRKK
jgi:hypothetical protein